MKLSGNVLFDVVDVFRVANDTDSFVIVGADQRDDVICDALCFRMRVFSDRDISFWDLNWTLRNRNVSGWR